MCGPSLPKDNSAEIARQQAAEREAKITQGKQSIDDAFKGFDDNYYNTYKQSYLDNYNPQVDEQFGDARQGLKYNLARQGITDSTAGQKKFGDLIDSYNDNRRGVASAALDATNKIRSQVDSNKGDLYAQNSASADPSLSAIQAVSRAGSLQTPPSYSPIGDLFSGLIQTGTYGLQAQNQSLPAGYRNLFTQPSLPLGASSRVVN